MKAAQIQRPVGDAERTAGEHTVALPSMSRASGRVWAGFGAALAMFMTAAPNAARAEGIWGRWLTSTGGGSVEIRPCGAQLCGYLLDNDNAVDDTRRPDVGEGLGSARAATLLFAKFQGGPDYWTSGQIYEPHSTRRYLGSLRLLEPTKLKVTGCLVKPLCASQVWTRLR